MDTDLITRLGDVAARAANRAIDKGISAGQDQNRGQFVSLVMSVLVDIPVDLQGDETKNFIDMYKDGAYGASARPKNLR